MSRKMTRQKALVVLNYDLFSTESLTPPAPATLHTRIREQAEPSVLADIRTSSDDPSGSQSVLPQVEELYRMFDRFNLICFDGRLPSVKIEYSSRMYAAGSYTPSHKLIKIGRKYHDLFPADLPDTLKHEMIHILHFNHDAAFRAEAKRIGATAKARSHPALRRAPRYVYECPTCRKEYPRQKRLVMGSCGECSSRKKYHERHKLKLIWSSKRKPRKAR